MGSAPTLGDQRWLKAPNAMTRDPIGVRDLVSGQEERRFRATIPAEFPSFGASTAVLGKPWGTDVGWLVETEPQRPAFLRQGPSDAELSGGFVGHDCRTALCLQIARSQRGPACPMKPRRNLSGFIVDRSSHLTLGLLGGHRSSKKEPMCTQGRRSDQKGFWGTGGCGWAVGNEHFNHQAVCSYEYMSTLHLHHSLVNVSQCLVFI